MLPDCVHAYPIKRLGGKWSTETQNTKDVLAASAVGPGTYDDLTPFDMSVEHTGIRLGGVGGRQRETYKKNVPSVRIGPTPDPLW